MVVTDVKASLSIYGDHLRTAARVTQVLGIEPSHSYEFGAPSRLVESVVDVNNKRKKRMADKIASAFGGVKGSLWINARDRLIERFEHAQPDNPEWKSLKLVRLGARAMDAAGWREFKDATVKRAMALQDPE